MKVYRKLFALFVLVTILVTSGASSAFAQGPEYGNVEDLTPEEQDALELYCASYQDEQYAEHPVTGVYYPCNREEFAFGRPSEAEQVAQPAAPAQQTALQQGMPNLDESQFCPGTCTWDPGVGENQIGFIWGDPVGWDGNVATMAVLSPNGFYENVTIQNGGGLAIFNVESEAELIVAYGNLCQFAACEAGVAFADLDVWQSDVPPYVHSASGPVGAGRGMPYPTLDAEDSMSFAPEQSPGVWSEIVEDDQFALAFGVQITYAGVKGPETDDYQNNVTDPELRCDMAVLLPGVYDEETRLWSPDTGEILREETGVIASDARIEPYYLPGNNAERTNWMKNLIQERVLEQFRHYDCPLHEYVPIWNSEAEEVGFAELIWREGGEFGYEADVVLHLMEDSVTLEDLIGPRTQPNVQPGLEMREEDEDVQSESFF